MRPVEFKEQNCVYAKDQPEYLPLPAFRDREGTVISCWSLTRWERLKVLFTGRLWLSIMTFNSPLQPLLPTVDRPTIDKWKGNPEKMERPEDWPEPPVDE